MPCRSPTHRAAQRPFISKVGIVVEMRTKTLGEANKHCLALRWRHAQLKLRAALESKQTL